MKHSTEAKVNKIVHISTQVSLTSLTLKDKKQVVQAAIVHDPICFA